jgi:2-oxoisovalerate dehydrogenase E1 component
VAEAIDAFFLERVRAYADRPQSGQPDAMDADLATTLFEAQIQSRHLDFAARWLQSQGEGFYTIGSAGHEANAAVGLVTRVDDPALLHYRSGGFYAARATKQAGELRERGQPPAADPIRDVLLSLTTAAADPISGGRHKVFGHPGLHIVPQTSTIASHLPRAVGLAFALGSYAGELPEAPWPDDAIVVCSLGDASVNHSTAQGAFNASAYLAHRNIDIPVLFVCEDNGIGISTRTPAGWTAKALRSLPGISCFTAHSARPDQLIHDVRAAVDGVRTSRRPAVLHLSTVRFLGHAGSDVELSYRSQAEIADDYDRDPLLATADYLIGRGICSPIEVVERYESMRSQVMDAATSVIGEPRLASRDAVMRPLVSAASRACRRSSRSPAQRAEVWQPKLPEDQGRLTLGQSINAALTDVMVSTPTALVFGQDVGRKGGVYGVTRGLRRRFGGRRVFDTLLDEQTILGTALGAGLAGLLPIPEIQYLAYLHNAEDQVRGEAASLAFFSDGQYRNPMVIRIAGLAYQKGFGGHFHNDNSVAVLRDVPGIALCVPSHPSDAPQLLRDCVRLAEHEGRVCVYLEPIALYHTRDLHEADDGLWTAPYVAPSDDVRDGAAASGPRAHGDGEDLLIVTFGNGLPMSLRAARTLERSGIESRVLDLRWLAPLPMDRVAAEAQHFGKVLVVDETRASGGVAEAVLAGLVDSGYRGAMARVTSADSFVPLGPAADLVLLGERDIVDAALALNASARGAGWPA